ncbi:MAG: MgtC/SapB family protein [Armatimonadota bacterium]
MDLTLLSWPALLGRLGAAFLVGALIGLERERHSRPAGLRTHILVSMASALFAMVSILSAGDIYDPGRIAAQVVTGIGFLGAGTILRHGSTIRGLTTAASLWMAAALGLAAGFGWYQGAAVCAMVAFLVLTVVKLVEDRLPKSDPLVTLVVHSKPDQDALPDVLGLIRRFGGTVVRVKFGTETLGEGMIFHILFMPAPGIDFKLILKALDALPSIEHAGPGYSQGEDQR